MENKIRERRKELGLSQEELAKKCGVSRQTVNAIENNKYDPTLALAFSLARNCTLRWMNCLPPRNLCFFCLFAQDMVQWGHKINGAFAPIQGARPQGPAACKEVVPL